MLDYYFSLALRSFRRDVLLTTLMISLTGLGVAASMTLIAQLRAMTTDPIPTRSNRLYTPVVDPRTIESARPGSEPPIQLTWTDAMNLFRLSPSSQRAVMTGGRVAVGATEGRGHSFFASARYTTSGVFKLFDVPLVVGRGWSQDEDESMARVAVLSSNLARQLFRTPRQAIGSSIALNGTQFTVVGVIGNWNPKPRFYDVGPGAYNDAEDVFVPLASARALKLPTMGSVTCWGNELPTNLETAPCAWIQYWISLEGEDDVRRYQQVLDGYSEAQRGYGRFVLPSNTRLYSVQGLLDHVHAVPPEPKLQLLLALGFLVVCVLNSAALILAKFLKRRPELAIRRAMGATRRAVFIQLTVEASSVGLIGSMLAICLIPLGLWVLRQQPLAYASLIAFDMPLYALTIALSVLASTAAGVYPAWNACRTMPAGFIKVQ